ncbi:MAG TPA: LLM class F420-dependent oxidoreductase [Acidimicrobiales bacterium]|nr:LLM class F420-dependent oxidoreductase [Acidimicrobiales bacterium]
MDTQRPLQVGIATPVLTMLPDTHASWEVDGSIEDVAALATTADRLGYSHLTCSEHVIIPPDIAAVRGSRYWDPLATFGYLGAVTTRIRFSTNVLVLGYHHPLEIAKRYGTLDQVTGGRVTLGLGVGSLKEEFDLLGVAFDDRGPRADDALRALRAALSQPQPEYDGPYYKFADVVVDPCARQAMVPLWIGGRTARSLRRAVELGDGWVPFGLRVAEMATMVANARQTPTWAARQSPPDIVLGNARPVDPTDDPDGARQIVDRLVEAGATGLQLSFVHHSLPHYLEQLEAMAQLLSLEEQPG